MEPRDAPWSLKFQPPANDTHTMRWMREGYAKINDQGSLVTLEIILFFVIQSGKMRKGRIKGERKSWSSRQSKYFVLLPLKMI